MSLDTGAMAVAVSLKFASMVLRAQDEHYRLRGWIDPSMLVLSHLGRIDEQRFVGFAETDWSGASCARNFLRGSELCAHVGPPHVVFHGAPHHDA